MAKVEKFKPYAARRTYSTVFPHCIVAAEAFEGYMVVYERPAMPEIGPLGLGVCVLWWHKDRVNTPRGAVIADENTALQVGIARIKKVMLTHGAVAEAVMLIGAISPFTEKELKIMAEKLKGKTPPAKTDKPAAKGKGADKGTPAKGKGNPEALKKAREASEGKRAEARLKKIKALKKPKEIEAREGTFRHRMLTDLLASKTVGDFYDAAKGDDKYDAGCLRFAEGAGYVTVG